MSQRPPTTDQLRQRIDSGLTGEKVAFPDPAAAPLGTDAEAGGVPPGEAERALEAGAPLYRPPLQPSGLALYLLFALAASAAVLATTLGAALG